MLLYKSIYNPGKAGFIAGWSWMGGDFFLPIDMD